jgi:hypothetical protein
MSAVLLALLLAADAGGIPPAVPPTAPPHDWPEPPAATLGEGTHLLAALAETTLVLGAGAMWYWRTPSSNGWDISWSWNTWRKKVLTFQDVTFDGDRFNTNAVSHPHAGLAYYQIARGNGYGFLASFFWSVTSSVIWELFVEVPERPSINDMIMTPAAGAMIGEATFQLGRYLASSALNPFNVTGAGVFSPVATLNELATHTRVGERKPPMDDLGFSKRATHAFAVEAGWARSAFPGAVSRDQTSLGVYGELFSRPDYAGRQQGRAFFGPGAWTALQLRMLLVEGGRVEGLFFTAGTLLAGWHIVRAGGPDLDRVGLLLGLSSQFAYDERAVPQMTDHIASAGLVGPHFDLTVAHRALTLRIRLSAHYAFAQVDSLAFASYPTPLDSRVLTTALRHQGYYYGQGVLTAGAVTVRAGPFEAALDGRLDFFTAISGRDPNQHDIEDQATVHDGRRALAVKVGTAPFAGRTLQLGAQGEHIVRTGRLLAYTRRVDETRITLAAALRF